MFKLLAIVLVVLTLGTYESSALSFDRVLVVVLENQPLRASMRNPAMREIIKKGTLLTEYYALVNPSQPNYVGLIAGDLLGVTGDGVFDLPQTNLVDLMEAKGVSWKSYQENYPGNCFAGDTADGIYKRKHNPFISFNNIRNNPTRCANIVEATQLSKDLEAGTVPQFSFYTPNMNNNGHDTGLEYTANWLNNTFLPKFLVPFNNTGNSLMVITFDEGIPGDNQIYTLLIGDMIPKGYTDSTRYTHYSLLRLFEDNFGLGTLNRNDAKANPITAEHFDEAPYADLLLPNSALTTSLVVILPAAALLLLGVLAYSLYFIRQRKRNMENSTNSREFGTLLQEENGV